MFEKVHYVSVNKRNEHQLLIHMFILYLKDVVTLLNPEEVSRGEYSRESGECAVEAECDTQTLPINIQTIEVEDEIQVATKYKCTTTNVPPAVPRARFIDPNIPKRQLSNQQQGR